MRFIPFLDKIPEENITLLGKANVNGTWHNCQAVYWGVYEEEHAIQAGNGGYIRAENFKYLCEDEVEEYEAEEVEKEVDIAHVFGNIKL